MPKPPRFDARWQRRRRRGAWWRAWRWWIGFALVIAASAWLVPIMETAGEWEPVERSFAICGERGGKAGCVIDGDTLAIGQRRIRLTGFDAPEIDGQCEAERRLAMQAREALRDWLNRGPFLLDGGAEPPRDRYGRELRAARREDAAGQQWLAEAMIGQGLARDDGWLTSGEGWCD